MKKQVIAVAAVLSVSLLSMPAFAANKGEAVFKEKCASCHPDGGNIINAAKHIKGIKKASVIIQQVRKGGGGMPAFDAKAISDADAKLLASYIMKTFKK